MNPLSSPYKAVSDRSAFHDASDLRRVSDEEMARFVDSFRELLENLRSVPQDRAAGETDPQPDHQRGGPESATSFMTQQMAQTAADGAKTNTPAAEGAADSPVEEGKSDAVEAFMEYMAKTPEERYFEAFLNAKGMTEEGFQALPPEDKQALLREFEDYVKRHLGDASAERIARAAGSGLF